MNCEFCIHNSPVTDGIPGITRETSPRPLTTLWRLGWQDDALACVVYKDGEGLQLRLESAAGTIISERFDLEPRMMARTKALRAALVRRGWQEINCEL